MSKTKKGPQFGRKMDPCEYGAKWANRLPENMVVAIKAVRGNKKVKETSRDEER